MRDQLRKLAEKLREQSQIMSQTKNTKIANILKASVGLQYIKNKLGK